MDATCKRTSYNSTQGRLYEAGRTYDVDPESSFAQDNFDVDKPAAEAKGKTKKGGGGEGAE